MEWFLPLALILFVAAWYFWARRRANVTTKSRQLFIEIVSTMKQGDYAQAERQIALFNHATNNALRRLTIKQLIEQHYINLEEAVEFALVYQELQNESLGDDIKALGAHARGMGQLDQ